MDCEKKESTIQLNKIVYFQAPKIGKVLTA